MLLVADRVHHVGGVAVTENRSHNFKDLSGNRYGKLLVLDEYDISDGSHGKWKCKCDCGKEIWAFVYGLTSGRTTSCGCSSTNTLNIVGEKYGFLTVISQYGVDNQGVKVWECLCDCGKTVYRTKAHLKDTSSCGCLRVLHRVKSLKGQTFTRLTVINDAKEEYIKRKTPGDLKLNLCRCECGNEIWASTVDLNAGTVKSCGCLAHEILLTRNISLRGENHPFWTGGSKSRKYCYKFSRKSTRERVREFWGCKCVVCGKTESENGTKLSVHHVYENKDALCDTTPQLFVILCKSCHSRFHHAYATKETKEYMTNLFLQLINDKGGKCMYTDEEYFQMYHNIDIKNIK